MKPGLYRDEKIPAVLPAILIMSNRIISRELIQEIWEEIKMPDIIETAREKGIQEGLHEGKILGIQEGKTIGIQEGKRLGMMEAIQEMIVDDMIEKFDIVPINISEGIRKIRDLNLLKGLHCLALKCQNMAELENLLNKIIKKEPLYEVMEDIEMLDAIEIARRKAYRKV